MHHLKKIGGTPVSFLIDICISKDIRWPNGVICPRCGVQENPYRIKRESKKREILRYRSCKKEFSVTTGTVFEGSHILLITWFRAFVLLSSSKKGISSHQLSRMLGITQENKLIQSA